MKHFNYGDENEGDQGAAERPELRDNTAVEQLWTTAFAMQHWRHAHTNEREQRYYDDRRDNLHNKSHIKLLIDN